VKGTHLILALVLTLCYRAAALSGAGSVLLSGPSGSGKTMAVRAVCSCLNLHLFKVLHPAVDERVYHTGRISGMFFKIGIPRSWQL